MSVSKMACGIAEKQSPDQASGLCHFNAGARLRATSDLPIACTRRLASLPFPRPAGILVIPTRMRAVYPLLGEALADLRFPFGVAVGDRDLAVHRRAVAVLVGHGRIHLCALRKWCLGGIMHRDHAVTGE